MPVNHQKLHTSTLSCAPIHFPSLTRPDHVLVQGIVACSISTLAPAARDNVLCYKSSLAMHDYFFHSLYTPKVVQCFWAHFRNVLF